MVFLGMVRFIHGGGERKGVIFLNFGPLDQWFSVFTNKLLTKAFLESCIFLFFFVPESAVVSYPACDLRGYINP